MKSKEIKKWNEAKACMGRDTVTLGPHYTYVLKNLPRRLLFVLSRYKFAAKIIGQGKDIIEVGCSEGFGTNILMEEARRVVAVDFDIDAIACAKVSFTSNKVQFMIADIMKERIGSFDAAVALDVIEHIYPSNEKKFLMSICANLKPYGLAVIGTPNKTAGVYASKTSKLSHVNVYTAQRLRDSLSRYFHQVMIFSANDEVVHTGFYPMAHYLIGVGIARRS
ncbi:MAG: class I SAM-dependent methyltransferase [Candidatus Omnitrophota bacterium]